jgi:hypothetical protein
MPVRIEYLKYRVTKAVQTYFYPGPPFFVTDKKTDLFGCGLSEEQSFGGQQPRNAEFDSPLPWSF